MRILIVLFFLIASNSSFAQDESYSYGVQESLKTYYPLPKDDRWYFSLRSDSLELASSGYDTIIFCSAPFSSPFFLALIGDKYLLFDPALEEQSRGSFRKHVLHKSKLYVQRAVDWLEFDFLTKSSKELKLDSIMQVGHILYPFKNGKMGIMEYETEIPPIYDRIISFVDPMDKYRKELYLVLNNGKFGLLNQDGEVVLPIVASIIQHDQFEVLKYKEGTWKYLLPGGMTVNPQGKEIHFFSSTMYKIYNASRTKATLYNLGEPVVKTSNYDDVFSVGRFYAVRKEGQIGLLGSTFNLIKSPFCDQIETIQENVNDNSKPSEYFKYLQGNKWGLMDKNGRIVLPAQYSNVLSEISTENGVRFKVTQGEKVGIINRSGAFIVPLKYDNVKYLGHGYIVDLEDKLGYLNQNGQEVLKLEYDGYHMGKNIMDQRNDLIAFVKSQRYHFVNTRNEVLKVSPCVDYSLGNNIMKCYYIDHINVHFLENGRITETTKYPQVRSVSFESKKYTNGQLSGFDVTTLELNQQTGLYGMRNQLKDGFGHDPKYPYFQQSAFVGWFDAGELADSSYTFQISNFPMLNAYRVFNWMCQDNGNLYDNLVLSSAIFKRGQGTRSSSDCSILYDEDDQMSWITRTSKDPIDAWVRGAGLLYDEALEIYHQKVYAGGSFQMVPVQEADLSMMEYFNYVNVSRNIWFTSIEDAKTIMNPLLGVKFTGGRMAIRDKRSNNRKPFKFDVDEFKVNGINRYYSFKKKGQSTWNLCTDIETKDKFVEELISVQEAGNEYPFTLILEKNIKGQRKKAIYGINLQARTEFIYDEIIRAGSQGYLVRQGQNYFYINP